MAGRRKQDGLVRLPWFSRTKDLVHWCDMTDFENGWWKWYFCRGAVDEDDPDTDGITYLDHRTIVLSYAMSNYDSWLYEVVYHELHHAAHECYEGSKYRRFNQADEHYAIHRSQRAGAAMLRSMGWRLPPLPKALSLLRPAQEGRAA